MAEIRTIFFDIGGVLLTNGWDRHQRKHALTALGADLEAYEARHADANYFWERGLWTEDQYFEAVCFYKPQPFTKDQLWKAIEAEQAVLFPGAIEILKSLHATGRYTLATLNNESRRLNNYRLEHFGLAPYFHFRVCSAFVGEMKPAPSIYREAIEISGRRAEECAFIDDKLENAEAATRQGMHGIHFESPEQLADDLHALGVQWS